MKKSFFILLIAFFFSSVLYAGKTTCRKNYLGNIVCSDGGGYRKDFLGNWQGTGNNRGGGWRKDFLGNDQGTGNNRGKKCRYDFLGNYVCNY